MSKVETSKSRAPVVVLVILLTLQLLLMSSQARARTGGYSMLRSWMLTATYPINVSLGYIGGLVHGVWYGYIDLRNAREESARLQATNDQLSQELVKLREEVLASHRQAQLAQAQKALPYQSVAAKVIARDGNQWFNQVIIDRGSLAGLRLNQPVITPGGIVGRIVGIGPIAAQVQLITDGYAGAGGQLVESRAYGEVKGVGKSSCEMRNVSGLENVKEGEAIITTGFDGIYPKGLLIGYVERLVLGGGAKNHDITVRPAAGLERLEEVLVLRITEQDLKIEETVK
ncbi:MAG: rod shape-determining protein MreC [Acidobacteriota bacterium]